MTTEPQSSLLLMAKDAAQEAESALAQLQEVTALMRNEEYMRALGAFEGLEDRVHYVGTVLARFARVLGLRR
jgi:UDP-N-acetylmuramoylalanine-D-glutamate ligase